MRRRASGTPPGGPDTYGPEVSNQSLIEIIAPAPGPYSVGEDISFEVTVSNSATIITPSDPDRCGGAAANSPVGYEVDIEVDLEDGPTSPVVSTQAVVPAPGGGGGDLTTASETVCVPAFGGTRGATFSIRPQSSAGAVTGQVRIVGSNSGNVLDTAQLSIEIQPAPGGGGGGDGDGGGGDGGGGGDDEDDQSPPGEEKTLTEWWEARSQTEKAAIAIGGVGLVAALSGR